jgi:hypothetical protein
MRHEISYGHLPGEQKGDWPAEKTDEQEQAAEEFQYSGNSNQREQRMSGLRRSWEAEKLLGPMLHEKKSRDDS